MDCRPFRRLYPAYLDDALTGANLAAVLSHIMSCDQCAARDVALRRGLLIARNLPPLRPSSGFRARLQARLEEERRHSVVLPVNVPALRLLIGA